MKLGLVSSTLISLLFTFHGCPIPHIYVTFGDTLPVHLHVEQQQTTNNKQTNKQQQQQQQQQQQHICALIECLCT